MSHRIRKIYGRNLDINVCEPGTPWSLCYVEGENAMIPKEAIRDYFRLLSELKKFNSSMIDESEIEGRFDPVLGYYVLPADDEDEGYYDI